jgi:hypothetical protein
MKNNYAKYPDLIFIDTSMKHKIPLSSNQKEFAHGKLINPIEEQELTMILISGTNSEGKSIIFAWGFLKDTSIENYTWMLNKFILYMAADEIAKNLVNIDGDQEDEENSNPDTNVEFISEE